MQTPPNTLQLNLDVYRHHMIFYILMQLPNQEDDKRATYMSVHKEIKHTCKYRQ